MRKNILNNLNLDIFNIMIQKKLLEIEFYKERFVKDEIFEKILNDFFEPDSLDKVQCIENVLNDPMLQFTNNLLDYDYYATRFAGFDIDGWDCIDILLK
tara:strand:- start:567 stop:863 length:297 start_codon:yes stop_codon:yes gene_type:complete